MVKQGLQLLCGNGYVATKTLSSVTVFWKTDRNVSHLAYSVLQPQIIATLICALPQVAFYAIIIVRALECNCIVYTRMNVYVHNYVNDCYYSISYHQLLQY